MRTRDLIARNNELFEQLREELRLNRQAAAHNAQAFAGNRDLMRKLMADMDATQTRLTRQSDAVLGAFADLAAEIRSWRDEGPGRQA